MGSAICREEKSDEEVYEKHKKIEERIKESRKIIKKIIKILLLGSADSGKSTIAKQMRILHANGFNETELINYRYMIHTNFILVYYYIISGLHKLKIPIPQEEEKIVNNFFSFYTKLLNLNDEDQIKNLNEIRNCTCVIEACKRINEIYVPDNTAYLFSEANRILQLKYIPTQNDVIHARASTTGVHEISFSFRKFCIRLIDVGGQKTERRKWIHCFEGVTATLFVVSLSCYDQFLENDPYKNRLDDSVELFKSMYMNEFLIKSSFILFLNKKDLFEEKIKHNPISKYFSNFECSNEYNEVFKLIANLFLNEQSKANFDIWRQDICHSKELKKFQSKRDIHFCNISPGKKLCGVKVLKIPLFSDFEWVKEKEGNTRHIYIHATNATDTKNIEFVFGVACEIILQNNLSRAGMN